jgi:hypothetical protein
MSEKNKKIDKLLDGFLDEESKSNTLIMHSETKKVLLDDTIELLKEKGISIVENDFVPEGEVFCVKKGVDDTSPEVVYGQDITYLPYSVMPKPPIYREPEVKSKLKLKLARSNINDVINTDDGTVTFTLSFYKKKDCYKLYEFHDKKGFKHAITIHMTKPYKDSFGFSYYNLEVRHQADAGGPVEVIDKIKIPDSYKKWCDCVAYMHGIYRDEKDSCYKVVVVFGHSKALFGEKIILK